MLSLPHVAVGQRFDALVEKERRRKKKSLQERHDIRLTGPMGGEGLGRAEIVCTLR